MQRNPLTNLVLVKDRVAIPLKFIVTGEAAIQSRDLIRRNSGGLSIKLFHDMLLSDSPQAGTIYSRTIADKSRVICGLWCGFYDNGTAFRTGVYAAVAVGGVSVFSSFSIILFTLS